MPKLREQGVAVHAITSEPGAVVARLSKRGCASMPFPVLSDPEHKLCAADADDFYVIKEGHDVSTLHPDYVGVIYDMVQPALVVVNRAGQVVQRWSWATMDPRPEPNGKNVLVDGKSMLVVQVRPQTADIMPSVVEKRAVRLGASMRVPGIIFALVSEAVSKQCCCCGRV